MAATNNEAANKAKFNVALMKAQRVQDVIEAMNNYYEPETPLNAVDRLKIIGVLNTANFLKFKKSIVV